MKTFILCGGFGSRIDYEGTLKAKPMIRIGTKPILMYIVENYISQGYNDFVFCLGHKSNTIINYFLKENKKKYIPLNVSAPFHCSLMNSAADKMKDKIYSTNFKNPNFDIVCNVTSKPENNPEDIKRLLVEQIYSTVRWRESIINISKDNVTNFIEIGPGKVLSGMVKRTVNNINCFSINSIDDMKKTIDEFKK